MNIHPTAIVSDGAKIGAGVTIGPGSVIGSGTELGDGVAIGAHAVLEHRVIVGEGTRIGHGAIIGANPQDLGFDVTRQDTGVRIGRGNTIREYATIHRATRENGDTVMGDDNFIMTGGHLGHDSVVGNGAIIANNVLLGGHVRVGDRSFLGGGSVFHQFVRIGTLAMVRGGCRFSKDVPPYLVATGENHVAGINAIGLRRAGISAAVRTGIKKAFRLLYSSGLNVSQALEAASSEAWEPEVALFFDFVREAKKRGICDYVGRGSVDEE